MSCTGYSVHEGSYRLIAESTYSICATGDCAVACTGETGAGDFPQCYPFLDSFFYSGVGDAPAILGYTETINNVPTNCLDFNMQWSITGSPFSGAIYINWHVECGQTGDGNQPSYGPYQGWNSLTGCCAPMYFTDVIPVTSNV